MLVERNRPQRLERSRAPVVVLQQQ
jgi:hypothetical protein